MRYNRDTGSLNIIIAVIIAAFLIASGIGGYIAINDKAFTITTIHYS